MALIGIVDARRVGLHRPDLSTWYVSQCNIASLDFGLV